MTFGEHIRQWREERGVGLRRFAKAVGVSPTFVSKMERGIGLLPGEETIHKIGFPGENAKFLAVRLWQRQSSLFNRTAVLLDFGIVRH
jgi:transcriptional regulator with XRE-family HTH domain